MSHRENCSSLQWRDPQLFTPTTRGYYIATLNMYLLELQIQYNTAIEARLKGIEDRR